MAIPVVLVIIELGKLILDIIKEKKAKFIEEEITEIHDDIHEVQVDQELLKEDINESVDAIIERLDIKEKYERTRKLIVKLIENGYLTQRVVYNLIKPRQFYFIFTYNARPNEDLREFFPKKRQLILQIIEKVGFIRVSTNHSFYIISPDNLKKEYRDIEKVRKYIINKFNREVRRIKNDIKEKDKDLYEKIKTKQEGYIFNYSFIISTSNLTEMSMEFHPFSSFSTKFKDYINGAVNLKSLKKETADRKHEIKKFILKISNELLLDKISEKDKLLIQKEEEELKKNLGISRFTDYANVPNSDLNRELLLILNNREKVKEYVEIIKSNSNEYSSLLSDMGIVI